MSTTLLASAPLWLLGAGTTLLLLLVAWRRDAAALRRYGALLLLAAATGCALSLLAAQHAVPISPLLAADGTAQTLALLFCLLGWGAFSLPAGDALSARDQHEEYYLLLLLVVLGACLLAYARHAASLVLGIELMSLSAYALIAYPSQRRAPLEAAIKYLLMSAAASASILFGLALLYAHSGGLALAELAGAAAAPGGLAAAGAVLLLGGLAVKTALVPFQLWTPDVYDGAPTAVSALLVSATKGATIYVLYRFGFAGGLLDIPAFGAALAAIAIASILAGNWLALLQHNLKRLLAYSSIAHSGYMLLALAAATGGPSRPLAQEAGLFYLFSYLLASFTAFALLAHVAGREDADSRPDITALRGLLWRAPLPALLLMLALLSMAGVPLTAGFVGKVYLFSAAAAGGHTLLLWALVLGSAIGVYYYLRVVYTMTLRDGGGAALQPAQPAWRLLAGGLAAGILLLGIAPAPFMAHIGRLLY